MRHSFQKRERGYILIVTSASAIMLASGIGLAIDVGKMYVAKSELQAFADASAVKACLELDGTSAGVNRAIAAAAATGLKWNFNSATVPAPQVQFATSGAGPWSTAPASGNGYRWVRVTTTQDVHLFFLPILVSQYKSPVQARSVAAQVAKTVWREGLFPFSPYAHNSSPPDFGLTRGNHYTLRWPSNPTMGNGNNGGNVCPGDRKMSVINMAEAAGGSERGYIEESSANNIRLTIEEDYQTVVRAVGDIVTMTGGAKQSQQDSLEDRIAQDTNTTASTYSEYISAGNGNGRRIIAAPINDGGSPMGSNNRIVGIGAFFLRPSNQYGNGGNQSWCAEYIGPYVQGSTRPGAGDGTNGSFVVRLTE
ncbi:MAG: pilus assembly protein TadG-related protein [Bryobacteraceae bacterium]|nr:pilus assembly protein TadG-related protein [Bryobacteraceae bacterium]